MQSNEATKLMKQVARLIITESYDATLHGMGRGLRAGGQLQRRLVHVHCASAETQDQQIN